MKLSIALGIVLASLPSGTAFAPSALVHTRITTTPFQYESPAAHPIATPVSSNTCLSMVGGGMIERPSGDDSSGDNNDGDSSSDADISPTPTSSGGADPYATYAEEKEKFLKKIGRDIDIDPWDPNPYIKPRPGKYGWKDKDGKNALTVKDEMTKMSDEEIAAAGQVMSDSEREENLNVIRRLRQNDVPVLRRTGDLLASAEAAADANARERKDPWFDLNERLGDAIKYEMDDVEHLKALIEKVGGPPPQLVKYADHPRGYVLRSEVIGMAISNERLERMIDRRAAMEDKVREENRKESVRKEMAKLDNPIKEENDLAEIEELARKREENWMRGIMDIEGRSSQYQEAMKEEQKEYDEKRKELLKQWGGEGSGEDEVEYIGAQAEFVDKTMKDFVTDLKRMNNMFEDDEDDESGLAVGDDIAPEETFADSKPMSKAAQARAEAMKNDGSGRPRLPGDPDVTKGELAADVELNESSTSTTGPLTVEVSSAYNTENSDPPMRKHCFQYTVRITNNSDSDTVQLLSRRFEIQTVGSSMKDVVQGEGVTGRQPVLQPGEVFEYTSTAPLSVRPIGTTEIAARMSGEYRYCILNEGQEKATDEQVNKGQGEAGAELATFHFVFPEEQRVKPVRPSEEDDDDDEEDAVKTTTVASAAPTATPTPPSAKDAATTSSSSTPASSLPGEPDMISGNISTSTPNDASDTLTSDVRVVVTSTYRPERSDAKLDKHCFAYNVRITNESKSDQSIQLVSRRFEIQTVGSANKDVVQGPGVTGRQPVLKPGESFEYTSTAPLSVRPMLDKTKVVARMSGEYNFVQLAEDGKTPMSSTPLKAELGAFHFILPE
mmetsp:Transcript_27461/g.49920  ORF Transcript_27461/g.49920 Transcript_27461/m.49920 type:complete len:838 (+) Transcript_27461:144-2657(+)